MKGITRNPVLVLALAIAFSGCKAPQAQIDGAKAAIEAVTKAGADKYAVEELKAVKTPCRRPSTKSPLRTRSSSRSSDRQGNARQRPKHAEDLKAALPAKIEAAKNLAIQLQGAAKTTIDEAKALLAKAPNGKGTKKDIDASQGRPGRRRDLVRRHPDRP